MGFTARLPRWQAAFCFKAHTGALQFLQGLRVGFAPGNPVQQVFNPQEADVASGALGPRLLAR